MRGTRKHIIVAEGCCVTGDSVRLQLEHSLAAYFLGAKLNKSLT